MAGVDPIDLTVQVMIERVTRLYRLRGTSAELRVSRVGSTGFPLPLGVLRMGDDGRFAWDLGEAPYSLPPGEPEAILREVRRALGGADGAGERRRR